jgi:hypothetical protein
MTQVLRCHSTFNIKNNWSFLWYRRFHSVSQPVSAYRYSEFVKMGKPVTILAAFNWSFLICQNSRFYNYPRLHMYIQNGGECKYFFPSLICSSWILISVIYNFPIVNFAFICTNIPVAPAYGEYISQLIRYSRAYGSYQDFLDRGLLLTRKLLNQWFLSVKLMPSLRKFYGGHHDLIDRYGISVSQMTTDMLLLS